MKDAFVDAGVDISTHEDETNEQLRTNKIVQFLGKKDNDKRMIFCYPHFSSNDSVIFLEESCFQSSRATMRESDPRAEKNQTRVRS